MALIYRSATNSGPLPIRESDYYEVTDMSLNPIFSPSNNAKSSTFSTQRTEYMQLKTLTSTPGPLSPQPPPLPIGFDIAITTKTIPLLSNMKVNNRTHLDLWNLNGMPLKSQQITPVSEYTVNNYEPIDPWKQSVHMQVELAVVIAQSHNPKITVEELSRIRASYRADVYKADGMYNLFALYPDYAWYIHPRTSVSYPDRWSLMGIKM